MYDGIKKATGPTVKKMAPQKSVDGVIIKDRQKQMERWVEHYLKLYSRENFILEAALEAIDDLPIMTNLDFEPTIGELSSVNDSLANNKAADQEITSSL